MSPSEPPLGAEVETVLAPAALPPTVPTAVFTNAVVAICVVSVPATAVVDNGVPVNVGLAKGAYADKTLDAKSAATIVPLAISADTIVPFVISADTIVLLVDKVPSPKVVLTAEASASSSMVLANVVNDAVVIAVDELKYGSLSVACVTPDRSSRISCWACAPIAVNVPAAEVAPVPPSAIAKGLSSTNDAIAVIDSTTLVPSQYTNRFSPFLIVIPVPPEVVTSMDCEPDVPFLTRYILSAVGTMIERVAVKDNVEVTSNTALLDSSAAPSVLDNVLFASDTIEIAPTSDIESSINSKAVFTFCPQVEEFSPSACFSNPRVGV